MKIAVLGSGRVGKAIIRDLAKDGDFLITASDISQAALDSLDDLSNARLVQADLSNPVDVAEVVRGSELVVSAVPGSIGFQTLEAVLEAGKNIVDISFFEEDPFLLEDLAREKGLVALVDCGIAPGCSNLILGYLQSVLDEVDDFSCLVGGLPVVRTWPYEYKAVFSPADVLEEYTRPARYVSHGEVVTFPALSEPELVEFAGVGTLEAFNTDGLRSILKTCKAPSMKEKTLRYPGHIGMMRVLRETGFFRKDFMEVKGARVRPLDLTAKLLFPLWQLSEGEADFTVMRVEVGGVKNGQKVRYTYNLLDHYDAATQTTSMARTTGYTCTAGARLVASGAFKRPGISPPEFLGREEGCYLFVMKELAKRGVVFRETVE